MIKREELLRALEIVKPALADKEIIEQTTSFCFLKGRVTTYNDEISISAPIPGLFDKDVAIKAEELYKLLGKIKRDEIEIELTDKELLVKSGRVKAGIVLHQEVKLPLDDLRPEPKEQWRSIPEDFAEGVSFAIPACSKDMSKPIFTCVHIRADGFVEASDNFRITRRKIGEIPGTPFLIPQSSARDLVRYKSVKCKTSKGWAHFMTSDKTIFSCRIYDGEFPELDSVLNVTGKEIEFPEKVIPALDRAVVFVHEEHVLDESIQVHLMKNKLKVTSRSEAGWFEESMNMLYDGKDLEFSINPGFLAAVVQQMRSCTVGAKCLKFEGHDGKWIHVVATYTPK